MVIDERLDIVVWSATLLLFLLMGARAWSVETAKSRNYRTSARTRVLTGSVWVSLVALVGLLAMQGGVALVQAIATSTEPEDFVTVVDTDGQADGPDDDGAPPADPNAPGPGPGAPAGPDAPGAPEPGAPEPGGPEPGAPEPGAPEPGAPEPGAPAGGAPGADADAPGPGAPPAGPGG